MAEESAVRLRFATRSAWPTRHQELLLRAALLRGPDALAAWSQWKASVDIDQIDSDSYRVLPLLYHNLRANEVSDPFMGRLRGIYRRTWYQNQVRMHAMTRSLGLLAEAGIQTMVLKGAALISHCYRDYGLRPMEDVDILVPVDQARPAIRTLLAHNFVPCAAPQDELLDKIAEPERHVQIHFKDPRGYELDLQWRLFQESLGPDTSQEFWPGVAAEIEGIRTRVLTAADQLLHVCVHGLVHGPVWSEASRVRWVADAVVILRSATTEPDWSRLLSQAQRCGFVLPLRDGLAYLQRTLDVPIPNDVTRHLRAIPVSMVDRVVHQARTQPPERWGPWLTVRVGYVDHALSLPAGTGALRTLAGLPEYYRRRWRANRAWHLPFVVAFRGMRRAGWTVRRYGASWASRLGQRPSFRAKRPTSNTRDT